MSYFLDNHVNNENLCDKSPPLDQNSIKCIKEYYFINHDNFPNINDKFTNVAYNIDTRDKEVGSMGDVFELNDEENSEVPKVYEKYRSTQRTEKIFEKLN